MQVRPRRDDDLGECVRLARLVHETDRYPAYLPGDLESFLVSPRPDSAWVAVHDGELVGHVALHRRSSELVMEVARSTTGLPEEKLAVVARLFVSPTARRLGAGRSLLHTAADAAYASGKRPLLDVAAMYLSAIAMYESAGWTRAGVVSLHLPDGSNLNEIVFVAPARPEPRVSF